MKATSGTRHTLLLRNIYRCPSFHLAVSYLLSVTSYYSAHSSSISKRLPVVTLFPSSFEYPYPSPSKPASCGLSGEQEPAAKEGAPQSIFRFAFQNLDHVARNYV
jgi:hypothetical protein